MGLKRDFTWSEISILIGIKNCSNMKDITINKMVTQIKINRGHPQFYMILSYLVQNKLVEITKIIGNIKLFKINYTGIRDLLDEQILVNNLLQNYLKKDHTFIW